MCVCACACSRDFKRLRREPKAAEPGAPTSTTATITTAASPYVAEYSLDFLLAGVLNYVERECQLNVSTSTTQPSPSSSALSATNSNRQIDYANSTAYDFHNEERGMSSACVGNGSGGGTRMMTTTDWGGEGSASSTTTTNQGDNTEFNSSDSVNNTATAGGSGVRAEGAGTATEEEAAILSAEMGCW